MATTELCWDCGERPGDQWDDRCRHCIREEVIEVASTGNYDAAFDLMGDGDLSEIL
jgi:hypothetical protein